MKLMMKLLLKNIPQADILETYECSIFRVSETNKTTQFCKSFTRLKAVYLNPTGSRSFEWDIVEIFTFKLKNELLVYIYHLSLV